LVDPELGAVLAAYGLGACAPGLASEGFDLACLRLVAGEEDLATGPDRRLFVPPHLAGHVVALAAALRAEDASRSKGP
jgi:hypothetical protein